jgi:hypothetical protein
MNFIKNNKGQLITLAGIMITISILSVAFVSVNLSSIYLPLKKGSFLKEEYDNVRREFGGVLKDRLNEKLDYEASDFMKCFNYYFNETKDIFSYIETLCGFYFNAEFISMLYKNNMPSGFVCVLTLSNDNQYIEEEVIYDF